MQTENKSEYKIRLLQKHDMVGVSKKDCSGVIATTNNQNVLVATHKTLYKLQYAEGRYSLNLNKFSSKNEDEEFHLLAVCSISRSENYIYICTRIEKKEINQIMVFRNDFKDLVDTVPLPFKPITIKHILYNESIYTVVFGEALTAVFVLASQKDKKLCLVQIFEPPMSLSSSIGIVSMDYFVEKKQTLYVATGSFDGIIKLFGYPIETEDKTNEKQTSKFFTKQHTIQDETKLQLPITSINLEYSYTDPKENENLLLVVSSSLGYLMVFDNVIKNKLSNPLVLALKNENKLDSIMDCVLYDMDDDGEKEIVAVTYLGDLFVIKKEEEGLRVLASRELDACFYNVYIDKQGDKKFIILCGDNEVKIFEFGKE